MGRVGWFVLDPCMQESGKIECRHVNVGGILSYFGDTRQKNVGVRYNKVGCTKGLVAQPHRVWGIEIYV